jgi:DNA-binding response OmpR family regulator
MHIRPRVAIVEDELDLLETTCEFLADLEYTVWGAASAEAFYRRQAAEPADVVVLDIGLPGEDGLSVAALLQTNPAIAVIILSARDMIEDRLAGLRVGADRYLVKPISLIELAANIDAVARRLELTTDKPRLELPRQKSEPRRSSDPGSEHLDRQDIWCLTQQDWLLAAPNGKSIKLTAREFALLHHLVEVQGQVIPKKTLADELFGTRTASGGERLVVMIARLRKKATESLGVDLPLRTAHHMGYAFTAPVSLGQKQVRPDMPTISRRVS